MKLIQPIFLTYLFLINCYAYGLMWYDKYQSKQRGKRVSENKLFFIAFFFGAIGIFLGMKSPIYHKAAKTPFKIGIPLLIVLNAISVYLIYRFK